MLSATRVVVSWVEHRAGALDEDLTIRVGLMRARHDAASRERADAALERIARGEGGETVSPDELVKRWRDRSSR